MLFLLLFACAPRIVALPNATSDTVLPTDPLVHQGILENGLHWYVEPNAQPQKRAELRLVVRAGSVLEDEDQRGLAHVLEHMAFNGTEHYPGGSLVQWFESVGMKFGAHVNAYTSFDETVYTLTVPTDRMELLDQGLGVLRDQGAGLLLDPKEVEKERGVVLEEWRTGRGAGGRVTDTLFPITFAGSRYAERLPIGTPESIQHFELSALQRFYKDWYRPDLMAVVAVGDFEATAVEGMIRSHFGGLTNPSPARERPTIEVPPREKPMVGIVADPELTSVSGSVLSLQTERESNTWGAYRATLVENMAFSILNERYAVRARASRDWLGAGAGRDRANPSTMMIVAGAELFPEKVLPGMEALLEEVVRAQRYGFTAPEIARAKVQLLATYDQYYRDRNTADSADGAAEIVRVFTTGEAMPGITFEYRMAHQIIPTITAEELAQSTQKWLKSNLVIELTLPQRADLLIPTEEQLKGIVATVAARELAPPATEEKLDALVSPLPKPGKVTSQKEIAPLGVTVWTLANGVEVWVKPTDYEADEVVLGGWSPGGTSLASDADYFSASAATGIRGSSGLGNFDPIALDRQLAGKVASAWTSLGAYSEGVSGTSSSSDLESMFQLVYLDFVAPRFTPEGFALYQQERRESLRDRLASPDAVFGDAWSRVVWQDHLRHRPWGPEDIERLDLATAERFYRERFSDAGDFRFVIVGNVEPSTLKPLVERYLGSLPSKGGGEKPGPDTAAWRSGVHDEVVRAGLEPKARVELSFHGDFESNWMSRNRLQAMADVLEVRLREELREERGGVYGVNVGNSTGEYPKDTYSVDISFVCDPARVEELKAAALQVVAEMREKPVDAHYVESEKEMNRRQRQTTLRSNSFWVGSLIGCWERGEDPSDLLTYDQRNDSLTPEEVQAAARQYLNLEQLLTFELLPAPPAP